MIQISRIIAKRFSNQGPRKDQHRLRTTGSRSSMASKIARRACLLWAACCCVNVMPAAAAAAPAPNAALSQSMPLQELLWREVKTTDGQSVGTVSDVLC